MATEQFLTNFNNSLLKHTRIRPAEFISASRKRKEALQVRDPEINSAGRGGRDNIIIKNAPKIFRGAQFIYEMLLLV